MTLNRSPIYAKNEINKVENEENKIAIFIVSYFLVQILNLSSKHIFPIPLEYYSLMSISFGLILVVTFLRSFSIVLNRSLKAFFTAEGITLILFLTSALMQNAESSLLYENFIWAALISVPLGVYAFSINNKEYLYNMFLKFSFLMSTLLILMIFLGNNIGVYSMSFSYALLLPILFHVNEWLNSKKMKYLFLSIIQIALVLLYGSRGAILSIFSYIVFKFLFSKVSIAKKLSLLLFSITIISILYLNYYTIGNFILKALAERGYYSRTLFLLFNSDITNDAGRMEIFRYYLNLVGERPIIGWGIMGGWLGKGQGPHNMVIELLLSFGVIFGGIITLLTIMIQIRIIYVKDKFTRDLILIFMSSSFVLYFISGDYIQKPSFFILVGLLLSTFRRKKKKFASRVE
ncbi:hypothetical protein HNQ80_002475 [Anaerosolibacter carboniphilus]|uniref:O-antigen ligase-related domain-containing protein n=1 Tax=Anaerosolibacter carboniphilus TaxID=1417629 RepID=A0A841L1Y9_9FIRM|nr:O-antigen ligase family protein [Anaerosolibacter carboniphilus]MBB6216375.1 hypothetical protein [Anaerosolibacter carboniphilus]